MNPVDLQLSAAAIVRGAIYDSMEPRFLRESLLEIDLPSGLTIAAGWVPHCDPRGEFQIVLFHEYLTETKIEYRTRSLEQALATVRTLATEYLHTYSEPGSCSQTHEQEWAAA